MFPVFLSHTPAGASTYQLLHYVQGARSKRFAKFDYGSSEMNLAKYGSVSPPDYKLKNVRTRVILHYADNDWLAAVSDVKRLHSQLPDSQLNHMPDRMFEHMDFIWGSGTRKVLYNEIIGSMKLYDRMYSA